MSTRMHDLYYNCVSLISCGSSYEAFTETGKNDRNRPAETSRTSQHYRIEGFKEEVFNLSPIVPKDGGLSDSYTSERCSFSILVLITMRNCGKCLATVTRFN